MVSETLILDPAAFDDLGFGELLEACDLAGVDMARFTEVRGNAQMRLLLAVAFIVRRRDEPGLTWTDAQRWKLEAVPKAAPVNPTPPRRRGATNGHSPASRSLSVGR